MRFDASHTQLNRTTQAARLHGYSLELRANRRRLPTRAFLYPELNAPSFDHTETVAGSEKSHPPARKFRTDSARRTMDSMPVTDAASPAELRGKRRRGQAARAEPELPRAGGHDAT